MSYLRIIWLLFALCLLASPAWSQSTSAAGPLPDAPNKICPLPIGSPVPAITLQTLDAEPFDLNARLKNKPTVLIYFRGGW